jgi:hypothetical protein
MARRSESGQELGLDMPSTRDNGPLMTAQHAHHWKIVEPNGPLSRGCCLSCKEEREFANWLPDLDFVSRTERSFR